MPRQDDIDLLDPYYRETTIEAAILGFERADWESFKTLHIELYGHPPMPDLVNKKTCTHVVHAEMQRLIEGDGVEIALHKDAVDPATVITQDDPEIDPRFNIDEWEERSGRLWDNPRVFWGDSGRES